MIIEDYLMPLTWGRWRTAMARRGAQRMLRRRNARRAEVVDERAKALICLYQEVGRVLVGAGIQFNEKDIREDHPLRYLAHEYMTVRNIWAKIGD